MAEDAACRAQRCLAAYRLIGSDAAISATGCERAIIPTAVDSAIPENLTAWLSEVLAPDEITRLHEFVG